MDKASFVKDAITYIQHLENQVKEIQTEIAALQSNNQSDCSLPVISHEDLSVAEMIEDHSMNAEIPIQAPIMAAPGSEHAGQTVLQVNNYYLFSRLNHN